MPTIPTTSEAKAIMMEKTPKVVEERNVWSGTCGVEEVVLWHLDSVSARLGVVGEDVLVCGRLHAWCICKRIERARVCGKGDECEEGMVYSIGYKS